MIYLLYVWLLVGAAIVIWAICCRFTDAYRQWQYEIRENQALHHLVQLCRNEPLADSQDAVRAAIVLRQQQAKTALTVLFRLAAHDEPDDMEAREVTGKIAASLRGEIRELERLLHGWERESPQGRCNQIVSWAESKLRAMGARLEQDAKSWRLRRVAC